MAGSPSHCPSFCPWDNEGQHPYKIQIATHSWEYEGKAASTGTSSLVLSLTSHSEYFPGTWRRKWVWAAVDLSFGVFPRGKSCHPELLRTRAHMGEVSCLALASGSCPDISLQVRILLYLGPLLPDVTGQVFPNKRCTVPETCCSFATFLIGHQYA